MLLFSLCYDCFTFNSRSSLWKFYGTLFYFSFPVLFIRKKNANNFATALKLRIDFEEEQEYMQLDFLFEMIPHFLWVLSLGVKDMTKKFIFTCMRVEYIEKMDQYGIP